MTQSRSSSSELRPRASFLNIHQLIKWLFRQYKIIDQFNQWNYDKKRAQFHIMLIFLAMSFPGRRNPFCGSVHEEFKAPSINGRPVSAIYRVDL